MTGLRQGELLGLRWRDVDLNARKVRVVSPYVRGEFGDPKSEGSGRSVPLAERVVDGADGAARALALRGATATSSSAIPRPGIRSTAPSSSGDSSRRSARRGARDHLPRAAPHFRHAHGGRRACPCGRSSTGWVTRTRRRPRSMRTTSLRTPRRRRSIRRSAAARPRLGTR